jgi:molybdate transport system substrate-binding protein
LIFTPGATAIAAPPETFARAAVASNFHSALKVLVSDFQKRTNHKVQISTASTGALFAQIIHGAPFDIFLSADRERPRLLVERRVGVAKSLMTYARGRLVVWNGGRGKGDVDCRNLLKSGTFDKLAIANPTTAPYGLAASQTLEKLGLLESISKKLVRGANIAQTYQFVMTGNAQLGFVALSQFKAHDTIPGECRWVIPEHMHEPIDQQAVLLRRAEGNVAANALLAYLKGARARTIIGEFGYAVD